LTDPNDVKYEIVNGKKVKVKTELSFIKEREKNDKKFADLFRSVLGPMQKELKHKKRLEPNELERLLKVRAGFRKLVPYMNTKRGAEDPDFAEMVKTPKRREGHRRSSADSSSVTDED
jgi:hypothetical protein